MTDGIYDGYEVRIEDRVLMVMDDMSELLGLPQFDYMVMDGAVYGAFRIRQRDENGHTISLKK